MGDDGDTSIDLNFGGDSSTPVVSTTPDYLPPSTPSILGPTAAQAGLTEVNGVIVPSTPGSYTTSASSSSANSLSNIFATLAQGAQAGLKIFQQAEGPTNIGGVLYNPATGQYYNPTTGQVVNASGTSSDVTAVTSLLSSPIILYGGLALVGVMVISMMGHK